jgi:uncharacterized protein YukE
MNKYISIIEQEIEAVKGYIERCKGVGTYHDNCVIWGHHLNAYERILELFSNELKASANLDKLP